MSGCSPAAPAATSFNKLLCSSVAIGRAPIVPCSPPETQIGGLRFLCSGGGDFASSFRNVLPLVCLGRNSIRSVANSSTPFSESQDELEPIIESQPHLPDQENLSSVRIKIQLRKECQFGEQFFVVGSQPELGLWNPLHAIPMTWSDDHFWTAELDLPIGEAIQFKLLLREVNGELLWQPGQDRVFHTWETNNIIRAFEDWENPEAQQVTEEQESDALKTKTKQLEHSNEKYNEEDETVAITKTDMDRVRSEGQTFSTPEISGNQVVDEYVASRIVTDEVAISDTGLIVSEDVLEKEQVPSLVPGLNPCSTTPTEDVTVKEEHVKVEPDISIFVNDIKAQNAGIFVVISSIQLDQKQEKVKGHSELEEATSRLRFNDEHAPTPLEHLNELAPNNDEDVNGHLDQDLESAFSESQFNKGTDLWGEDIKWGQSTLKRFLNNLGFP